MPSFIYRYLPAAVRYLSPVPFTVRSGSLELRSDSSRGILERERTILAQRPSATLERVTVLVEETPGLRPASGPYHGRIVHLGRASDGEKPLVFGARRLGVL